jgi:hypothetical protein
MKRMTLFMALVLLCLVSSEGSAAWVKGWYRGFDQVQREFVNGDITMVAGDLRIDLVNITGVGYGSPYYGGWYKYNLDNTGDMSYDPQIQQIVPIRGTGTHSLKVMLFQWSVGGKEEKIAETSYIFSLVYPAPTLSIGSTGGPYYNPVLSWNDLGYDAVYQNTTNGYEIYRRDYHVETLWQDWRIIASVSGAVTTWTDLSLHGAPMGLDRVDYKIRSKDVSGVVSPFSTVCTTKVFLFYKRATGDVPTEYSLKECYPNPFNPTTQLQIELPSDGYVSLHVLDIQGREVGTLKTGFTEAGSYNVRWNAASQASGVYFARLVVSDQLGKVVYSKTNKLLLTK